MSTTKHRPHKTLRERALDLQRQLRQQRNHGSRLLGRFYRFDLVEADSGYRSRMRKAIEATFTSDRDRRLHGLDVATDAKRLRSEVLAEDIRRAEGRQEELEVELVGLRRQRKRELRREEDAVLLHEGEVVRRWRETDPKVEAAIATRMPSRLKREGDFEAVGLPIPDGLQEPTRLVSGSEDKGGGPGEPELPAHPSFPAPAAAAVPASAPPPKTAASLPSVPKTKVAAVGAFAGSRAGRGAPRATAASPAGSKTARAAKQAAADEGGK